MSESRCAQELEGHPFLYDLAGAATPGRRHRRSPRTRSGRTDRQPRGIRTRVHQGAVARPADPRLTEARCIRIFSDKKSGKNAEREELWKALDYLREGDTLAVSSLDRLGRSIQDLIAIVSGLRKRGVGFTSPHEALDTTTPGGRLVFHVFAALAEFIRELIVQGTNEGLDAARARGTRLGRPPAMTEERVRHARDLLACPENTVASIAKLRGVSRNTIYNYVPELKGGRLALAEAPSTPELPQPARPED
ncbi:recombinase family protein [Streptomyces sp. NPDC086796]|uniref:recombinase family protein n=1 Tax=unclassified Streptomyces TaxID=2593676 RepID=UPI00380067F2